MVLKETIISKHIIKPSSPTPHKFRNYKLSYLDQIAAPVYTPLLFFYESKLKSHSEISQLLKQSLSHILTVCYPFAGALQENSYTVNNDRGVEFVEARVRARLAQVIEEPQMEELKQLSPVDALSHNENSILLVKLSFFDCGGIVLGVCLSHKIGDYASIVVFMNAWAATCRGDSDHVIYPRFDLALHFPPKDSALSCFSPDTEINKTNRLVFDGKKLEWLKQHATSSDVKNPTTVEALSIFFWQQFIEAHKHTEKTTFALLHAINLRSRTIPPIPDQTIGNCMTTCFTLASNATDSSEMLSNLRASIRAVDDNYIKKVVHSEESIRMMYKLGELFMQGTVLLSFTSWWRFPVYDVDFGWGKPAWVGTTPMPYKNTVILMSTPSGDGIEAWVNMSQDLFQKLQTNISSQLLN